MLNLLYFQVEPYFITLALFDIRSGKKITEDFHFDINHENMTYLPKHENDSHKYIQVANNLYVAKEWLFKQKQVNMFIHFYELKKFSN